jgi:hypothetical protein
MGCVDEGRGSILPWAKEGSTNTKWKERVAMKTFRGKIVASLVAVMFMVVATAGLVMAEDSIIGTIVEKGDVIVLDAADGSYVLEGSDLAAEMVGKKVKVTGTVAEKENMKIINVLSMEEFTE